MCKKACATDIEIAHIDRRGGNDIDNGIPLCYDCHAKIGHYNREHPRGNKYKPDELKARREQVYEEYTQNLVPPIHFYLDQRKVDNTFHDLPFVGFRLQHVADSLPVRVRIEARIIVGGVDLGLVNDVGLMLGTISQSNRNRYFLNQSKIPTQHGVDQYNFGLSIFSL